MGDDLIVSTINSQPAGFALAAGDFVALKAGGASDKVVGAMLLQMRAALRCKLNHRPGFRSC